ncbi:mitochondrial import translocase, subunit Tom22 [Trichocladium antarcticum]|uniref:Mitochondrial import translocase, subunit Tom22 n=1 Tax=Trichocladium antarcticum TaxID=1450529 RepID=A0AAN6ZGZ2_9PEZI|nr:mitochondrial import translocase, subunit Tom22 [Trichocladium antarcticum]
MVQLVEVEDEHFQERQPGPEEDDEDFTDTDSEISSDSRYDPADETLADRLHALRDMVPPTARGWLQHQYDRTTAAVRASLALAGRAAWAVSVTALLVGVPFSLAYGEDQQYAAMEQEQHMRELGGEVLGGGAAAGEDKAGMMSVGEVAGALGRAEARPAL